MLDNLEDAVMGAKHLRRKGRDAVEMDKDRSALLLWKTVWLRICTNNSMVYGVNPVS